MIGYVIGIGLAEQEVISIGLKKKNQYRASLNVIILTLYCLMNQSAISLVTRFSYNCYPKSCYGL